MDSSIRMKAPLCLIENSPEEKLRVNPDALKILSAITQPVVVVAIVGLYRTGKSYLMNKLVGVQNGFALGNTVQSMTKGIWMWCIPHPTKKDHTLVLLDTEGLGDVEKGDSKNDIQIFSLAVLLSSTLVYNSLGTINQDAIEKLQFVKQITELIKVKSEENDDEEAELSRHFPTFIWAVRDFSLKLELEGEAITEDEYLENALKPKYPEKTLKIQDMNQRKNCLRMYFRARKCFTFERPSAEVSVLQNMETVTDKQLNPRFVRQSEAFCRYIYNEAGVKCLDEIHPITGKYLGSLAKTYTETINSSNMVCMENAVMSVSEIENKAAVKEAAQHYEDKIKERVDFPTETMETFMELSGQCEKEALQMFMKKSFKDKDQLFQKELAEILQEKKKEFLKTNEAESRNRCEALIKKLAGDFEKALEQGTYTVPGGHQTFADEMKRIEDEYNKEPNKGVQEKQVLQEYLKSKEVIGVTILQSDNVLTEKEKELEAEKTKMKAEDMERKVKEEMESQVKQKNEAEIRTIHENLQQLMEKMEKESMLRKMQLERIISEKSREQNQYMNQSLTRHADMYQAQIDDLLEEKSRLQGPSWYTPIVDTLKRVAAEIIPGALQVGGEFLSQMVSGYSEKLSKTNVKETSKKK
ncbi:guanylate-binding protein 1-like [Spea bombifrons]|uniref:guanylate-binding protein 1-like n=1 Tax=Spea bombifrons TaxID=233779 RepID=UPI0023498212|nr:guanylate-binding protein 1-like [Spea bombifrons]